MDKGLLTKEKIIFSFKKINKNLSDLGFHMEFVIVGGSAFILQDFVDRSTYDVDLINKVNKKLLKTVKGKIDINDKVSGKGFQRIFEGWETEVKILYEYSNLTIKVLSDEMLVATKFFTRVGDRDISSMAYRGKTVNKGKLEKIIKGIVKRSTSMELEWMRNREAEIREFYRASEWNWNDSDIRKLL